MVRFAVLAGLVLTMAGCGGSSNPFGSLASGNLFGGKRERVEVDPEGAETVIVDNSILSPTIDNIQPEAALRGLIIRVTATAPTQGYHSPRLVARNRGKPDENGIITYEFRVMPPEVSQGLGPARTRQLVAATFIPDATLNKTLGFRVVSQSNVVAIRR